MQRILCFGDSNTYGLIPGTTLRYNELERYTGILKNNLSNYEVIEDGVSGRTTIFPDSRSGKVGIEFIEDSIIKSSPSLIIVMLGTNDLKKYNGNSEEKLESSMDQFLSKLNSIKSLSTKVLLISPLHLGSNIEETDYDFNYNSYLLSLKLDKIYKKLAKKYDYYFINSNKYVEAGIDNEHFTILSHKRLANALIEFVNNL